MAEPPQEDFFDRLVEILLPDDRGVLMVVEAYFDESERNGVFVVAGYGFFPERVKEFSHAWRAMLGPSIRAFHMTDLVACQGEFAHFTRSQSKDLIKRAAAIVSKEIEVAVAFSFSRSELQAIASNIRGLREPYSFCCYLCMQEMGNWMRAAKIDGSVAYVFEAGHELQKEANDLMYIAAKNPAVRELFHYKSHAFVDKHAAYPLQAADFLAWEWSKHRDETIDQPKRRTRRSLIALHGDRPERYRVRYLTGKNLRSIYEPHRLLVEHGADWQHLLASKPPVTS